MTPPPMTVSRLPLDPAITTLLPHSSLQAKVPIKRGAIKQNECFDHPAPGSGRAVVPGW
jgi:hypothetical protein